MPGAVLLGVMAREDAETNMFLEISSNLVH